GQSSLNTLERAAAVARHPQTGSGSGGVEEPRPAPVIPHCHEDLAGIRGIHNHVCHARCLICEKHSLPRETSVPCTVKSSLRMWCPRIADGANVNNVRVDGVNYDTVDISCQLKS